MAKNNLMALRRLHGRMNEWNVNKKKKRFDKSLPKKGCALSLKLQQQDLNKTEDYPIDIVVTWVDGNDPLWQEEKTRFEKGNSLEKGDDEVRFRDWGIFNYWFRAIEKNAPWVNKVFLVTCGHVPEWLNLESEKLSVVKHSDFIPQKYLPTFSSHTIELHLWRIPGLSEHFIYFNDDVFIARPVKKTDFFLGGLPKYCAYAKPIDAYDNICEFHHAQLNNAAIINTYFKVHECIQKHPEKWFSYVYTLESDYNERAYKDHFFPGNFFTHLGVPYRKSVMQKVCETIPDWVDQTSQNKFRTSYDIMHQIFQLWEIMEGTFEPVGYTYYGVMKNVNNENINQICDEIRNQSQMMVCINDSVEIKSKEEFERYKGIVLQVLQEAFPKKTNFEK